ncbi:MAG: flagellar biosynthesis protein FlhF [Deltaproteobacteria bacterium]|nr:flagellar biosynthesis protein FlhF [Deltaproteobacteria bacterium]
MVRVKRFYGRDSAAAMNAVKLAFGEEAVVLETTRRPEAKPEVQIEILAAIDYDPTLKIIRKKDAASPAGKNAASVIFPDGGRNMPVAAAARFSRGKDSFDSGNDFIGKAEYELLRQELSSVKRVMDRLVSGSGLGEDWSSPACADLMAVLSARKVNHEIAHKLLSETWSVSANLLSRKKNSPWVMAELKAALARRLMQKIKVLPVTEMGRVLTLLGPTGVGKTTTLAKLAAFLRSRGERPALLSLDTYRLGAAEQIQEYGRRLEMPVAVVTNRSQLAEALRRFAGHDRILLDTMGRSSRDHEGLATLHRFLRGLAGDTLLVLPASLQEEDLLENLVRFRPFLIRALLFTKLDETSCYGSILNGLSYARLPLSFFTDGQRVPDDFEEASPERLVNLLLDLVADD